MADALITPAELASYLQTDVDTASATLAIELATGAVQAAAGQRLIEVTDDTFTLYLDEHDTSRWLELPEAPVTAVTSVDVGGLPVTDYDVDLGRGRLYRRVAWRVGASSWTPYGQPTTITGVYSHGYALGDQRLQFARQVALVLAGGVQTNPTGTIREHIDDYDVQFAAGDVGSRLGMSAVVAAALRRKYGRGRRSALLIKG